MIILEQPETFFTLLHDKAHWEFELFVGLIEMIIFDLIFGVVIWGLILKPYLLNRKKEIIKNVIEDEHKIHGIENKHEIHY